MARAELNDDRHAWEIGQVIVAGWFKVLQRGQTVFNDDDKRELQRALAEIFKTPINMSVDPTDRRSINLVVPQPPENIDTPAKLVEYLRQFHAASARQYHEELGTALIFGCGKR